MATAPQTDPELMDFEALRGLANQELNADAVVPPQADSAPPEGTDPATAAPAATGQPEPDEIVYRRTIDLGDGGGVQVFEGKSYDELVDKLANAQTHATRKIRELSRTNKVEQQQTADEEYVLSQQLLEHPKDTVKKLTEELFGESVEQVREKLQRSAARDRVELEQQVAREFVEAHPEFHASPGNGKRMTTLMRGYNYEPTVENLEKVFGELQESGLLEAAPQAADAATTTAEHQATTRIAETVQTPVAQPRRPASGITAKRSVPVERRSEPTEDELYSMPLEELERKARASFATR